MSKPQAYHVAKAAEIRNKCPKCDSADIFREEIDLGTSSDLVNCGPYQCSDCGWEQSWPYGTPRVLFAKKLK